MRQALLATLAAAGLALAALPASALTVETVIAPEFQEKLEDDYGVREADVLSKTLVRRVTEQFTRRGVPVDKVVVTILDAKPNKPTFQQVADRSGLDPIRSFSIGGAKLSGVAFDASGKEIGRLDYDWYETDITRSVNSTTWSDARWAFDRFARRFATKLS
jgi:hypothetical protein